MTEMTLYGLKTCDTCRKARKALQGAGHDVEFVDVREMDDLPERLPVWIDKVGAERLLNKSSATWRNLSDSEKEMGAERTGLEALLLAHPALIKRPVIVDGEAVHAGWNAEVQSALGV